MDAKPAGYRPPRGFTLVELLTVVVIIGILAGLITAAAIRARNRAKIAVMVMETEQLDMALKAYKEKFGDYPPDFTDEAAVLRHLRRAFPRCPASNYPDFSDASQYNPATALVYWLGGPHDPTVDPAVAPPKLLGFSADPTNPFDLTSASRIPAFFDFNRERLAYLNGMPVYRPDTGVASNSAMYVYMRARSGGVYDPATQSFVSPYADETIRPYFNTQLDEWVNPKTFQLISAGLDGLFGEGNQYPAGEDYTEGNYDNVTNFSKGTLEDRMP